MSILAVGVEYGIEWKECKLVGAGSRGVVDWSGKGALDYKGVRENLVGSKIGCESGLAANSSSHGLAVRTGRVARNAGRWLCDD